MTQRRFVTPVSTQFLLFFRDSPAALTCTKAHYLVADPSPCPAGVSEKGHKEFSFLMDLQSFHPCALLSLHSPYFIYALTSRSVRYLCPLSFLCFFSTSKKTFSPLRPCDWHLLGLTPENHHPKTLSVLRSPPASPLDATICIVGCFGH